MKRVTVAFLIAILFSGITSTHAQQQELKQLALNIQKLAQFKQILRDMKNGYQIISGGYGTIRDIAEGNFSIHKKFLDGLLNVNPSVARYHRVGAIIRGQKLLVNEHRAALATFLGSDQFTSAEIEYMKRVYTALLKQSLRNLEELGGVLTAGKFRMSDDERLQAIDRIYADMENKLNFLRQFNDQAQLLGLQRAKEARDLDAVKSLHTGIK